MVGLWWVESIQPTMLNPFGAKAFPYVGLGLDHFSAKPKNFLVGLAEFLVGLRKITGRPKRNAVSSVAKRHISNYVFICVTKVYHLALVESQVLILVSQ